MRFPETLRELFLDAAKDAFGECRVVLFGSRIDDTKRGGDFDLAIDTTLSKREFKRRLPRFYKRLILSDMDVPVDVVHLGSADEVLRNEIAKGKIVS